MKRLPWLRSTLLASLGLMVVTVAHPVLAAYFTNTEIDPSRVVAIASPYGQGAYQLLILQQVKNNRPCWREAGIGPTEIDPLLLTFNFTGICERSTDSNGYSVRVGGEDLGYRYRLSIIRQAEGLRLVAMSNTNRNSPPIEIGRVQGIPNGFGKIELNPGWRLTKRVFNGRVLGHFYLTNEQSMDVLMATATSSSGSSGLGSQPQLSRPTPTNPSIPSVPANLPVVSIPATPVPGSPVATRPQLPSPPGNSTPFPGNRPPSSSPTLPPASNPPIREIEFSVPSIPQTSNPASLGFNYRVLVTAPTRAVQDRVRQLVPDAFRVVVNGRTMMQAGLFQERWEADQMQQRLSSQNLNAMVVLLNGGRASTPNDRF